MKVRIDREGCIECGVCEETCPDVFSLPENDKAVIVDRFRMDGVGEGEVGEELEACVVEASMLCPVAVIQTE
ncbi:MAG: ferredoxin [Chloroflexi bacterium]|nr:ferredoxin [Chloroflexota bacterium]